MSKKTRKQKRMERLRSNMVVFIFAAAVFYAPLVPQALAAGSDVAITVVTKTENESSKTNRELRKEYNQALKKLQTEYKQAKTRIETEYDQRLVEARTKGERLDLKKEMNRLIGEAKEKYEEAILIAKKGK